MASTKRPYPHPSLTTLLFYALALAPLAHAKIEYYLSADRICRGKGTFKNCESNTGLCAYDDLLDHAYCCHADYGACTIYGQDCLGSGNKAAAGQVKCQDSYCCVNGKEKCTQRGDQTNICWASIDNPYSHTSIAAGNRTLNRFKRSSPNQSTKPITFGGSSTASSDTTTTSPTSTAEAAASGSGGGSKGLSGGAIASIVVGAVVAVAMLLGVGFLLGKRCLRKGSKGTGKDAAKEDSTEFFPPGGASESRTADAGHVEGGMGAGGPRVDEKRAPNGYVEAPGYYAPPGAGPGHGNELGTDGMRVEAGGREVISEAPGSTEPVFELDAAGASKRGR